MTKHLYIITLILFILPLLLLSTLRVSAEPINIILKSPSDGAVIITYIQDFIYGFDDYPDMINCSLIVDDKVEGFRNTLIRRNDNKITIRDLEPGTHSWYMRCIDTDLNEIISETRTFTINLGEEVKEGYEIIYNANGLRSYVITVSPGQKPVELPPMKGGEDIQIRISGKTYYIDIIKMGEVNNTSFVEIRYRTSNERYRMLIGNTTSFDFDKDKTTDIGLSLNKVERSVNAYFVVTPYPGTVIEEPEAEPVNESELVEKPGESEKKPVKESEELVKKQESDVGKGGEPNKQSTGGGGVQEHKSRTPLIAIIMVIIIVILGIILLVLLALRSKEKGAGVEVKRRQTKPKKRLGITKGITKKRVGVKKASKKEENKIAETPEQEDWPVLNEKFEVIRSTGRKRKR